MWGRRVQVVVNNFEGEKGHGKTILTFLTISQSFTTVDPHKPATCSGLKLAMNWARGFGMEVPAEMKACGEVNASVGLEEVFQWPKCGGEAIQCLKGWGIVHSFLRKYPFCIACRTQMPPR